MKKNSLGIDKGNGIIVVSRRQSKKSMRRSLCFLSRGFEEGRMNLILVIVFPCKRQNSEYSLRRLRIAGQFLCPVRPINSWIVYSNPTFLLCNFVDIEIPHCPDGWRRCPSVNHQIDQSALRAGRFDMLHASDKCDLVVGSYSDRLSIFTTLLNPECDFRFFWHIVSFLECVLLQVDLSCCRISNRRESRL